MSSSGEMHTCVTCRVLFKGNEFQREHYKSDWHRYNLKRKVAQLPSITAEDFNNKVLQQRSKDEESSQSQSRYCNCCRKNFATENAYTNHLNSKRHKENETNVGEINNEETNSKISSVDQDIEDQDDAEGVDSDEWNEVLFSDNQCLFCTHHSRSVVRNLRHMSQAHSFFVPDIEYCTDIAGLITYLSEKVYDGFMCLWCNDRGRTFYSADAAQSHMSDKGHCKMLHDGLALAEYAEFYDYSSSYPTGEDVTGKMHDPDEEVDVAELDGSDYQLVLPSGAVVGHRSLMRYYKQRLDGTNVPATRQTDKRLHKVLSHYRAAGWSMAQQEQVARRAKDVHYMRHLQTKWQMKLSVRANKLQKHFRPQVNF